MKIIIYTTFTSYNKDVIIKPNSNLWQIINLGTSPIYIDEQYTLRQLHNSFGIDTTEVLIPSMQAFIRGQKPIKIINETQFTIRFGFPLTFGVEHPPYKFVLIQTFFKIQK